MKRVLRSSNKNIQKEETHSSKHSTSKKSKNDKITTNKLAEVNSEDNKYNNIFNVTSVLSIIFKYTDFNDLVIFNTVCKRWHHLTNPIIHKTIKLQRSRAIQNKFHDKRFNKAAKVDAEVEMCISNNEKYTSYIQEFTFAQELEPQRAIQLFETFKFISKLTLNMVGMSQDQFIGMINPLNQLQELNLIYITIKRIVKGSFATKPVELPSTLTKLTIEFITLAKSPELFVQTINSHRSLKEFSCKMPSYTDLLNPFKKNYPSLKSFEYRDEQLENPQPIINILELNTQLTTLNIELSCWNNAIMSTICRHLTNLEEFKLVELSIYSQTRIDTTSKFSHSTRIKKLSLCWDMLSTSSLESILLNCPQLEELKIQSFRNHLSQEYFATFNITKPTKIKKLQIGHINLSISSLDSILSNTPQLSNLEIQLPLSWKEIIGSIGSKCTDLKHLTLSPINPMQFTNSNELLLELYQNEFLSSNSIYKSTITSLTLNGFNFSDSKAEYFENFSKLKFITYLDQDKTQYTRFKKEVIVHKDLWQGYRYVIVDNKRKFDVKLIKL